jgi:hypothetical protein
MADIRLKTITIEPVSVNPSKILTIQNGDVNITNTTVSVNILSGAFIVSGGLSINCTYNSVSSTSGGALTIGGGLAVHNKTFLGSDLILDSNSSVINVNGITTPRLSLDNTNFNVAPDGMNNRFILTDSNLTINITKQSTNASTGALVINGGLSINSTLDSTDSSNGGALTVAGGVSIGGDTYISKSVIVGEWYTNDPGLLVRYTGYNQIGLENSAGNSTSSFNMNGNNLLISNVADTQFITSTGNFIFSNTTANLLTMNGSLNFSTFGKYVNIIDTIESLNSTTATLIVNGGISIKCTTDALSVTSGGGLTLMGGLSISKKVFTGDNIGINLSNANKNNKLMLYQSNSDLTQTSQFTGLGITGGSLQFNLSNTSNNYVFTTNSTEVFVVKGTNEVQFVGNNQYYSIIGGGNTNNDLSFQSQNIAANSSVNFYTKDGDGNDNNDIKIFGIGEPNNVVNSEYLKVGWDTFNYVISTNKTGTGNNQNIVVQTNSNIEQIKLKTDGTVTLTATTQSTCSTIGGLVLLTGGLSINGTSDFVSLTNGGSLTLNGGMSIKKSMIIGNTLNIYSTNGNIKMYSQDTSGSLLISNETDLFTLSGNVTSNKYAASFSLFSLNNVTSGNYEVLSVVTSNTGNSAIYNINSNANGSGILHPLQVNVGSNTGVYLDTIGNIGVNTTQPVYQLDINGSLRGNNLNELNQLTVYSTSPATTVNSSGSLSVLGGTSISKNLFVGGVANFTNTMESSSTSASVYISGGLTVAANQASNYGVGALTVLGGGSIGGELYVGQNLNVLGNITGSASSSTTFAYITITGTDEAVNLTTGSILTFGGIVIQAGGNATSVSNGGGLLISGGASVGEDVYIGGNLFNYGTVNYFDSVNSLINFYDITNILRFSIDRDVTLNDLSISRYNNSGSFLEKSLNISNLTGIITLNNTTASINNVSGALISKGGITITNTINSINSGNGGALTVFGGVGIAKDLYVNGITIFTNTTISTTNNNGGLIINTGVGITGNVNILGDTVISGSFTVNGTINNINSTNTTISDNIIVLNSGPSGTANSGFVVQRYQVDNDIAEGDVVNDNSNTELIFTLPSQSGMTSVQLKLPTLGTSLADNYYNDYWVKITSGFSVDQVRHVTGYAASTRVLTLDTAFTGQNPSLGDSVSLYNRNFVGMIFNETFDRFILGSVTTNPGVSQVQLTEPASLEIDQGFIVNSTTSINSSSGALLITGGIGVKCTVDSTSSTQGGALTIAGGASISKSLYVGNSINVNGVNIQPNTYDIRSTVTFNASNNVTNANIPGLSFDSTVWGVDIFISIRLIATTNQYSNYQIRIVNRISSWDIAQVYTGDAIVTFSINNTGQIQYTCQNYSGFTSLTMKFKAITN